MKKLFTLAPLVVLLAACNVFSPPNVSGVWRGTINASGGTPVPMTLTLEKSPSGGYTGTVIFNGGLFAIFCGDPSGGTMTCDASDSSGHFHMGGTLSGQNYAGSWFFDAYDGNSGGGQFNLTQVHQESN